MSQDNDPLKAYGISYGIDMQYDFKNDGTVDLLVDESGDIKIVGGGLAEALEIRRKNAIQQIKLRILTPLESLPDAPEFGSNLHSMIGEKNTDLNKMAVRAYVLSCLSDYEFLEQIADIGVEFPESGVMIITLKLKLIGDEELIEETIQVGG